MAVVFDSLRPNSACFEDPPKKARDKCSIEAKLHIGEQRQYLTLQRSPAGFVFAPDNSSAGLGFLHANGFDLARPEIQSNFYYAISLAELWEKDYRRLQKAHPKADFVNDTLPAILDWVLVGDFHQPDAVQKKRFAQCLALLAQMQGPERDFFAERLAAPLGALRSRHLALSMKERASVLLGILDLNRALSSRMGGLLPSHPLHPRFRDLLVSVESFLYLGEPAMNEVFASINSFAKDFREAPSLLADLPRVNADGMPEIVPLPPAKRPYDFYQILALALESGAASGEGAPLRMDAEQRARQELLVKWLRLDSHAAELKGEAKSAPMIVPLPSTDPSALPVEDFPLPPDFEEPAAQPRMDVEPAKEGALKLFPEPKAANAPIQAFVLPAPLPQAGDSQAAFSQPAPLWLKIGEGALCLGGASLTLYAGLQSGSSKPNPALLAGGGVMGLGCGAGLMRLLGRRTWNPYLSDSLAGAGGALLGFGIPFLMHLSSGGRGVGENGPSTPPLGSSDQRNPTTGHGP